MTIHFRRLTESIGAEVLNVDLSQPLSVDDVERIKKAFNDNEVLLFRNQQITEEQHIDFSKHFGELEIHVLAQYLLSQHPEILLISNIEENGREIGISDAGQYWHTDLSYKEKPSRCSVLYAREIPHASAEKTYGDTCYVSTTAAYDALDDTMKTTLKGLEARHHYEARYRQMQNDNKARQELTEEQKNEVPAVIHPVVRTHPETGRKSIYVNQGFTTEIVGLQEAESDALLKKLHEHCTQERFMYRHKWQEGDVLMWDNCSTQHLAIADYALPQRRLMHRTTVAGSSVI